MTPIVENIKLLFGTPEFRQGQQITVRVGTKWRDLARQYPGGFRVQCFKTGEESKGSIGIASIQAAIYTQLGGELSYRLAPMNHQENCRSLDSLFDELSRFYDVSDEGATMGTILIFTFQPAARYEAITGLTLDGRTEIERRADQEAAEARDRDNLPELDKMPGPNVELTPEQQAQADAAMDELKDSVEESENQDENSEPEKNDSE